MTCEHHYVFDAEEDDWVCISCGGTSEENQEFFEE